MYQPQAVIGIKDALKNPPLDQCLWPADALNNIPDWVYTSQAIHDLEIERIFRGDTWNFVALEAEIPNPGDYKRGYVGPTPVVIARAQDNTIAVFENRCAHRGAEFCRTNQGNAKEFVCPYHQWSYDLKGNLQGVPFKRGVDKVGGMPADFKNAEHGTRQLRVSARNGVVFATYSEKTVPLAEYLSQEIVDEFDVIFSGRKLKILGYCRNELPCNWKMYHENLKDPYHATLLHSFLVVFGLLVPGIKSTVIADKEHGRHGFMASTKPEETYATVAEDDKAEMRSFDDNLKLRDERFLKFVREFNSPWSACMMTVWPNLIVQRQMNTLGVRQIIPNGPDSMVMQWTMFGYEDDTPEMTSHRLRQGNLMGPAGFLGLEDNEALKFVQEGMRRSTTDNNVLMLDKDQLGAARGLISESCIRSLYKYYRGVMGIQVAGSAA
jgi:anthranilate 1,2-dioxygenase large subunit